MQYVDNHNGFQDHVFSSRITSLVNKTKDSSMWGPQKSACQDSCVLGQGIFDGWEPEGH